MTGNKTSQQELMKAFCQEKGNPFLYGATIVEKRINFTIDTKGSRDLCILFYHGKEKSPFLIVPVPEDCFFGNLASVSLKLDPNNLSYSYEIDGKAVVDPFAKKIYHRASWGEKQKEVMTCPLTLEDYAWKGERPNLSLSDLFIYRLHVRGFTKDSSSKVEHKGSYLGILEKIPYLKDLGVTMIDLMPAYDYYESPIIEESSKKLEKIPATINYWGYTDANYLSAKPAFATDPDMADLELKKVIDRAHQEGIEVSMEFYFKEEPDTRKVLTILSHWVSEYRIDALHITASDQVMKAIYDDPFFAQVKVFTYGSFDDRELKFSGRIARFSDDFYVTARKFLKSDEGQVGNFLSVMTAHPKNSGVINYLANHFTFTLYDAVSYDRKHNEANGESNKDGAEYNYSWNCGAEGETKSRKILGLRLSQMKNALSFLFTAQGIPMLMAGDEFANSAKGNNNPYCQDNAIGWVNWKRNKFSRDVLAYTKQLVAYRKNHSILTGKEHLLGLDAKALGLPDISYHGNKPWFLDYNHVNRHVALLYNNAYGKEKPSGKDSLTFIVYNLHWEKQEFELIKPQANMKWTLVSTTNHQEDLKVLEEEISKGKLIAGPRSVYILETKLEEKKKRKREKNGKNR